MSGKKMGNIRAAILQAAHLDLPEALDAGEESRRMVIEAALCTEYDLAELLQGNHPRQFA